MAGSLRGSECAAPAGARGTRTLRPSEKSNGKETGQLYTYLIVMKELFLYLKPPVGVKRVCQPLLGLPRLNRFRVFSKLLPQPRGWPPGVTSGDPATSLLRGRGPQQSSPPQAREDWRPAEPGGAGLQGGLCSVGAGPDCPIWATIGRRPRTGGRTSRAGPAPLAMSSACCTPNLSIYSTGIEAAGAALAPANHGWDFLFCPLFVSLWDLRRCHRFQGVSRK